MKIVRYTTIKFLDDGLFWSQWPSLLVLQVEKNITFWWEASSESITLVIVRPLGVRGAKFFSCLSVCLSMKHRLGRFTVYAIRQLLFYDS